MPENADEPRMHQDKNRQQLHTCNDLIRTIMTNFWDGVLIVDSGKTIRFANKAANVIFGCTGDELEGTEFNWPRETGKTTQMKIQARDGRTVLVELLGVTMEWNGEVSYFISLRDVTERQRMNEALRNSEALFRIIFDQAFQLMGLMKPDGTLIQINRTAADFINAKRPAVLDKPFPLKALKPLLEAIDCDSEVLGKPFWETPWWNHSPQMQNQLRDAIMKASLGETVRFEATHLTLEGKNVWVDFSLTPVKDDHGNVVLLVSEGRDITERKLAEVASLESEEKFSRAFLAVPNLLIVASLPHERYVDVNEAFERICGWRREEVFGRTLAEIDIWKNPADRSRLIRILLAERRLRDIEVDFLNRSGETFVGLLSAELTELCGVTCMIGIITDITERKRAEEALRLSEEKFAKVFRYVPSLLVVSSTLKDGRMIEVNEAFEKVFKYTREEAVGRSALDLNMWFDPEERIRAIQTIREKGEVRDQEIKFRDKDGQVFVGLYSATIIEIGGEDCLLSILNDITERKRQEEEIEKLNTDLAARALELETTNKELEAFSYSVSHDLRRPLTSINGYCQVILEMCGQNLGEQCRGYIREIYDGTLRMDELINALLNFSYITRSELHRNTVDLSALAHEVAEELKQAEPLRRVTFLIADGVCADGDDKLLRMVLDNVLGNAWKYTFMRDEGVIEFGTSEVAGKTACFVRDNGTGFDMANSDKLFTPFQRLPGAEECRGFGIGLATVERIIRRHGGKIWAEGEVGKGATFYFTLQS
jgi:PAS domain S-box-containing protein